MKKMMLTLSVLAITLGVATQASGSRLAEEGRFMQGPDVIDCRTQGSWLGVAAECTYEDAPVRERVLLTDNSVLTLVIQRVVQCMDGICEDDNYGFIGRVPNDVTMLFIPLNYYVWGERDGKLVAYKRGTGPARDQFPAWAVGDPNQQATRLDLSENSHRIVDVFCHEGSMAHNECSVAIEDYLDDGEYGYGYVNFSREEILEAVGFADLSIETIDCWSHACYNLHGDFIGLDPRSDFWQD